MRSMTGYGRCTIDKDGRQLTVEVKSVNHRFLDLSFRMPRSFSSMEDEMRRQIGETLKRGHVDVYVTYRNLREDSKQVSIDKALLSGYMKALDEAKELYGLHDDRTLSRVASFHDVLVISEAEEDEQALKGLMAEALGGALAENDRMREKEGRNMQQDFLLREKNIAALREKIALRWPKIQEEYRQRLTSRLRELIDNQADESRILTEAAIVADRSAIDEELVRLASHLGQLREMAMATEPIGRKLDFLVQEMNREVNTIGSKTQDIEVTGCVVECKSEIEKLREQVQNVE
ncbi:MAG: YicC/YloC family endoribonuclease [Eubacteriales bacterium]|nr:YicC/YloC family endoribonuclease [Eubacteriales bacterium]